MSKSMFEQRHVRRVYVVSRELQGKCGAVCIKYKKCDVCFATMYMPVGYGRDNAHACARKVVGWLESVLPQLPYRCVPVLVMDANGHVGLEAQGDGSAWTETVSAAVGAYDREHQGRHAALPGPHGPTLRGATHRQDMPSEGVPRACPQRLLQRRPSRIQEETPRELPCKSCSQIRWQTRSCPSGGRGSSNCCSHRHLCG